MVYAIGGMGSGAWRLGDSVTPGNLGAGADPQPLTPGPQLDTFRLELQASLTRLTSLIALPPGPNDHRAFPALPAPEGSGVWGLGPGVWGLGGGADLPLLASGLSLPGFSALSGLDPQLPPPNPQTPTPNARLAQTATQFLGYRYVWGGHSPAGFDCTGFTWYVAQQTGLKIPQHDLAGQMASGAHVDRADLQPGDLVFFQNTYQPGLSHVGIALGNGRFIHAASETQGVIVSRLDEPYWAQRYVGATRVAGDRGRGLEASNPPVLHPGLWPLTPNPSGGLAA